MNKGEIYVVDDEAGIRLLLSEIIGQEGFELKTFERPDIALNEALDNPPKLIFLDYLMESIRGDQFIKQLKEAHVDVPVVLMSGMASQELKETLNELDICHILEKPFSVSDVKRIINGVIGVNESGV
ncbi:response regulator [Tenuibacillus multivorans]|uniref:Two-component system, response regulator, stage 0 sporulation protein F n=1 Tax=Tenuibacillus multivorans TaxID=237069 RepID=A0A1G9X1A5_9BACI|nr:response regulator [Tenuibacillus multivorans]GEL77276.1 hypothetical protein TMU01_15110 [Tenuibacillus multivorans]SDM90311.1 two-component system, response regulator, stage 0 sporulation protein F [Tenuibacillus multivorans]